MNSEEFYCLALEWRDIVPENVCRECGGSGTATYHRAAIAGQALTIDVCDSCWGSGDRTKPWPTRPR